MKKKIFAAALLAQLMATGAWAQAAALPQAAADSDGAIDTNDIVVTAQKRSERLQDVPIAVNVVSADRIANSGITDVTQLSAIIPGFNAQYTIGSFQPSIRGVGTSSNVVENPVALYIDGVYMANQRDGFRDFADVEQIAVLKGPQGTLFGRNATAGVIQITTRAPSHTTKGEVKVGYDNYGTFRGSGYLTGGLSDTVAASLAISYARQGEGWGKSLSNGMDTYKLTKSLSVRGKLLFEPGDRTKITLIGDYIVRKDTGRAYQPAPGTTYAYPGFGPVSSRYDTYSTTPTWSRFWGRGVSAEVDHDLDFAKLVSITSYRKGTGGFRFDFTGVAIPYVVSTAHLTNENYTQEFQLISPSDGRFRWVAGAFYFHNRIAYPNFPRAIRQPFPPLTTVTGINSHTAETSESVAGFVQADYELTDSTTFTVGGRYTYEKREIKGFNTTTLATGVTIVQPAVTPNTLTVKKPTWRFALNHQFSRDISAYVSYNRGIKSGGFNIATPQAAAAKQETLDAYEVGFKSQLLDRRLTFNSSAFFYKYSNLQVLTFINNNPTPILTNGAKAEIYGIDADFQAKVTPELALSGGFQLMHSEFSSYPSAPISSIRPGGGAIIVNGSATGNRLPLAQKFVGTLAADYTRPIGEVKATFNVTATYNGDYHFEPDNFLRQPSYVMMNTSLRLSDLDDRMSVTFGVSNIFNESIITNTGTQNYAYFVNYGGAPRVYSVTAGLKF